MGVDLNQWRGDHGSSSFRRSLDHGGWGWSSRISRASSGHLGPEPPSSKRL